MKILHVVPTYWPAVRYGGPIVSIHALAREQALRGHEVEVFTTDADGDESLDVVTETPIDVDGVSVSYFPCGAPRRLFRSPSMGRALRARVAEFDLVHLHSVFLWPTLAAARAAERVGTPWVLSPRGMLVPELIRQRGRARKSTWIRLFEKRTVERAAFVHATSPIEATELERTGLDPRRVEVVPNGVELPQEEWGTCALPAPLEGAARERKLCLFLGRVSWKKNIDRCIAGLVGSPGVHLAVAGPDDESRTPELARLATTLGVGERVHFLGAVEGALKRSLLTRSDALVLASTSENFGNVVLEALAHGTQVLCTSGVGAAYAVVESGAGVVVDADRGHFARELQRTFRCSVEERDERGRRGRAWAHAHGSWSAVAEHMEEAYRRALCVPSGATS